MSKLFKTRAYYSFDRVAGVFTFARRLRQSGFQLHHAFGGLFRLRILIPDDPEDIGDMLNEFLTDLHAPASESK